MVNLRDLLDGPPLCEGCRRTPGIEPGDVAECGCIVDKDGNHLRHGRIWVHLHQIAAAEYYGWRRRPFTVYTPDELPYAGDFQVSTGVFHVPGPTGGGTYRKHIPKIVQSTQNAQAARDARLDEFAEALSEEFTVAEAAQLVGVSYDVGLRYFKRIREGIEAAGGMRCV